MVYRFFPVGILLAFLYLVTFHHRKLYSPSDFRTDESFLTSGDLREIGRKYLNESRSGDDSVQPLAGDEENTIDDGPENPSPQLRLETTEDIAGDHTMPAESYPVQASDVSRRTNFAAFAYMIEGLVMQELQNEYKSPIRRDAAFPMANGRVARVDGLIEGPTGPLIAEIKLIRSSTHIERRLRDSVDQLRRYIATARENLSPKTSGILVLVLDGKFDSREIERIREFTKRNNPDGILVRVLDAKNLMAKYGLDSQPS